jgi:hypothetical protein
MSVKSYKVTVAGETVTVKTEAQTQTEIRQDDGREQSEEPPAEYWEQREWEQQADVTLGCEPDFPGDER